MNQQLRREASLLIPRFEVLLSDLASSLAVLEAAEGFWGSNGHIARSYNCGSYYNAIDCFGQDLFNDVVLLGGSARVPSWVQTWDGNPFGYSEYKTMFKEPGALCFKSVADLLNAPVKSAATLFQSAVRCIQSSVASEKRELLDTLLLGHAINEIGLAAAAKEMELFFSGDALYAFHPNGLVLDSFGSCDAKKKRICITDKDLESDALLYAEPEFILMWFENDDGAMVPGEETSFMGGELRGTLVPCNSEQSDELFHRIVDNWRSNTFV